MSSGNADDANAGVPVERRAARDDAEGVEGVALERRGIDTLALGQVRGELPQALGQLPRRSEGIAALVMIEGYGEMDQGLEEEAPRPGLARPDFLQDFVADEELAAVEEVDAVCEARVHDPG